MTLTAAEQLALLTAMTADLPSRPDHRPQAEIDAEMLAEQRAEERKAARRGDHDGDLSRAWLAGRRAW